MKSSNRGRRVVRRDDDHNQLVFHRELVVDFQQKIDNVQGGAGNGKPGEGVLRRGDRLRDCTIAGMRSDSYSEQPLGHRAT